MRASGTAALGERGVTASDSEQLGREGEEASSTNLSGQPYRSLIRAEPTLAIGLAFRPFKATAASVASLSLGSITKPVKP